MTDRNGREPDGAEKLDNVQILSHIGFESGPDLGVRRYWHGLSQCTEREHGRRDGDTAEQCHQDR